MFDFGADARAEGGENGQNHKGLITIDRSYKKDAFYAYKAWLNPGPMIHLRGKLWFAGLFLTLAKKMSQNKPQAKTGEKKKKQKKSKNPEMSSGVMDMISSFTILRFTGMLGMRNVTFTKEELLKMNAQLNRIRKPKQ